MAPFEWFILSACIVIYALLGYAIATIISDWLRGK